MRKFYLLALCSLLLLNAYAQTSPKEHFGFSIGDDYQLATFTQTEAYFKKLAQTSDRAKYTVIGKTEEGRDQFMLIVSSSENLKNLEKYREISQRLARAENLTPEQARTLAAEGKAVVWIDGGLHATETVGIHQLIESAYQLCSRKDAETQRILDNVIVLFTHANPDGQELVSNWYMRNKDPEKRNLQFLPRMYEKYAGHDNNRDFYMLNLKETRNMGRQLFVDWIPQVMYNHHQAGPAGSVVAGAPYRDPFNYVFDPLIINGLDALGAAMSSRLTAENKPGYTQRYGSVFSTWYNGGLRTTTYFHNMLGLLTEIIGSPTPSEVPLVPSRLIPNGGTPFPVTPQKWHFRQSIDYSVSLNYAVLGYAVRYRDELLYNIYLMGKNSIDKGNKDTWSLSPSKVDAINAAQQKDQKEQAASTPGQRPGGGMSVKYFDAVMKDPALRDPRGYILPADQQDYPTAVKFINALIRTGILVHKASAEFTVNGKKYPAGSFIVRSDQAFRPHVLDMFEPQDHPNDFAYAGGPPVAPYDAAGWTLAYLMNVKFDRIMEDFNGPFERIPYGELQTVTLTGNLATASGYLLNAQQNNAFIAANDLLKAGQPVYRVTLGSDVGSFYVPHSDKAKSVLSALMNDPGLVVKGVSKAPVGTSKVTSLRIGLWDTYGGSMPSGWVRWMMEQFHFDAKVIYAQEIDAGNLKSKYDVIIFVPGAIPAAGAGGNRNFGNPDPKDIPEEFRNTIGRISADKSVPQLKKFMEDGGSVVTIGSSTNLAYHLDLPVRNALVEMRNGQEQRLPNEKYYIPGSVMSVSVDNYQPSTWGMPATADVYFDNSPVFKFSADAQSRAKLKPLMWFSSDKSLRSGWAWGQAYLQDGITAFEAPIGQGKFYAFGPEITFRAQTHGTFKLLFNQLYK